LRGRRDVGWSIIRRRHVEGTAVPQDEVVVFSPSGAVVAEDFETAIRTADAAADRRFEHADAAAQLAVIVRQVSESARIADEAVGQATHSSDDGFV